MGLPPLLLAESTFLQIKLPNLNDSASEDLERLLKEVQECEAVDFDLGSSTNTTSQPSLVEEPMQRSRYAGETFAERPGSQSMDYPDGQVRWLIKDVYFLHFLRFNLLVSNISNILFL